MTATLLTFPVFRAFDSNGAPLAGGLLYSYQAGTTTPLATYVDQAGVTQNTNPVVLDSTGTANVWLGDNTYKLVLKNKDGVQQWSVDNIQSEGNQISSAVAGIYSAFANTSDDTKGDALVGVKRGSAPRTQHEVNAETITAVDYGADTTGAADASASISSAQSAGVETITFTSGTYKISTNLTITMNVVMEIGAKFSIDSGKTLTLSGIFEAPSDQVFSGDGSVTGPKTIDANWFGLVNDGDYTTHTGTDNAAAFNAAIAACGTGGGYSIDIPSGIYKVGSEITVPSGIEIRGKGMWSTIIFCAPDYTGYIVNIVGGSSGYPTRVTGIGVLGNGASATGVCVNKNGTFIDNIWVNGFSGTGVFVKHTDVFISDFAFEINTYGIEINSDAVHLSNGTLYRNQIGLLIDNVSTPEYIPIIITNIRATDNYQNGFLVGAARNVQIANCSASATGTNYHSSAAMKITGSTRISVTNWVSNQNVNTGNPAPGIWVDSSSNVELTNCTSFGFQDGLLIVGSGENTKVIGGTFDSNYRHGINALTWTGPTLVITGASASYNGSAGSVTDCGITAAMTATQQRLVITSCISTQVDGHQDYGVLIANNSSSTNYGRVADCIIYNNAVTNYSVTGTYSANVTNAGII